MSKPITHARKRARPYYDLCYCSEKDGSKGVRPIQPRLMGPKKKKPSKTAGWEKVPGLGVFPFTQEAGPALFSANKIVLFVGTSFVDRE